MADICKLIKNTMRVVFSSCLLLIGFSVYGQENDGFDTTRQVKISKDIGLQLSLDKVNWRDSEKIAVQYIIKNVGSTRLYVMVAPTCKPLTEVGVYLEMVDQAGVSVCPVHCHDSKESYNAYLTRCANDVGKEIANYTYLEPNDYTAASVIYAAFRLNETKSKSISFAISALTRKTPETVDPLSIQDVNKAIPPARITTYHFPLIPFEPVK